MSFPELNESPRQTVQRQHWAKRWLREIFVEDLGLKILALLISLALWWGVTGQRTPTTIRVPRVPLNFRLPNDMEISNDPRADVEVALTGNKRALDTINVRDLTLNVDVSDLKPGEHNVQLTIDRVTMGLPDGVRFGDIQPNNVLLKLEPRVEREIQVEVRHTGSPAEGYELLGLTATPDKVKVRGPASHVDALVRVPTEIVSLDGRKESFTQEQTAVEIADKKIDLIDTSVSVRVEIEEQHIDKNYTNVTVQNGQNGQDAQDGSRTATVTLNGPRSMLDKLRAEDFKLALDAGADGSITPRLILPAEMEGHVELRSYKMSGFFNR
ncbi:MAG TPA: CdaR family protein [Pyrinomonadaceae bacterium]|nr:CdaR family protein [Pyrinomonadaceae bacterium]